MMKSVRKLCANSTSIINFKTLDFLETQINHLMSDWDCCLNPKFLTSLIVMENIELSTRRSSVDNNFIGHLS